MSKTICVAGSRHWLGVDCIPQLYQTIRGDHSLFDTNDRHFVVGDAIGIDTWATMLLQSFAMHLGVAKLTVYHIGAHPRNHKTLTASTCVRHIAVPNNTPLKPFTFRDQRMIDECEEYWGFWNGNVDSKGTLDGFEYARMQNKQCRLYRWDGERCEFVLNRSAGYSRS